MFLQRCFGRFDNLFQDPQLLRCAFSSVFTISFVVIVRGAQVIVKEFVSLNLQCFGNADKYRQTEFCVARFDMAHMGHGDADGFRKVLFGRVFVLVCICESVVRVCNNPS